MAQLPPAQPHVSASPVKSFFVSMLTRDIKLEDAVLDLLDNCIDGILRVGISDSEKPYQGKWAKITFSGDSFSIEDNCGGIPPDLRESAFRLGRDPKQEMEHKGTIGVYGIGMKRAIFKLGKSCQIRTQTQSGKDKCEILIDPKWMDDEDEWNIPIKMDAPPMKEDGTRILVGDLDKGVATQFKDEEHAFHNGLEYLISSHYAFIIQKGFEITVNGYVVPAKQQELIFAEQDPEREHSIQPYLWKAQTDDGVEVFLAVGFTQPIPSQDDVNSDQDEARYSSEDAGWTIICNDRAVVYRDRSELTGWGENPVPRYHTQFIAVSGVVEFRCINPAKLPTTTTKRGVDASSSLYLQVKNRMREGMKYFTDSTNRWKRRTDEVKSHFDAGTTLSLPQLKAKSAALQFHPTPRSVPGSMQYVPRLPAPIDNQPTRRRISFSKEVDDVKSVASHLFDDPDYSPSQVGERCFDIILEEVTD